MFVICVLFKVDIDVYFQISYVLLYSLHIYFNWKLVYSTKPAFPFPPHPTPALDAWQHDFIHL